MAKFDPFLSMDCARVEGVGAQSRKGRDQILPSGNTDVNLTYLYTWEKCEQAQPTVGV